MGWRPSRAALLAAAVFAVAAGLSAAFAWRIDRADVESQRLRALDMTGDHAHALQTQIEHSLSATFALAALVRQGGGAIRDFESLAAQMLPYYPGASALQLAPGGVVTEVHPVRGNEGVLGHDLLKDPERNREAFLARETGRLTLAGPFDLAQGGLGAVGRLPVHLDDAAGRPAFWGFTIVLIRFPETLVPARLPHLEDVGFRYELWRRHPETGMKQVIAVSAAGPPVDPVERFVTVPNGKWNLSVAPSEGWGSAGRRWALAAWSALVSLLLAYQLKLHLDLQAHRRGLEHLVGQRTVEVRAREADLNRAQSIARIGSWVSDEDGITRGSPEACRLFGVPEGSSLSAEELLDRVHPEDRRAVDEARQKALAGERCMVEFRVVADGQVRWVHGQSEATVFVPGERHRIVSTVQDITERKQAEADLRIAAAAFEAKEGMVVTDAAKIILRVNRAFTEITGYAPEEAIGKTPRILQSGRQDPAFYQAMWRQIEQTGSWHGEIWNRRKNGEIYPEWLGITAVRNAEGAVTNYIGTLTDITAHKAAQDQIDRLAYYDGLTGLPNRRLFHDRLQHALAASLRRGRRGAVLLVDLDDFSTLNDSQGQLVGDALLRQVGERLAACIRESDTAARFGGDEYAILLEDLAGSRAEAANIAENIGETVQGRIGMPYALPSGAHHQTASMGVVLFGADHDSVDDLMRGAHLAMHRAKKAGGNALQFFDPEMQDAVSARARLVADLRQGLREEQFHLAYQPQVDASGRLLGAEALVRWRPRGQGEVAPAEFIPVAEQTGLIVGIGRSIMEAACTQLERWSRDPATVALTLAVNLSAREFRHPEFVEHTLRVLERTGADPRKLMLEFTESVLLDDLEGAVSRIRRLKSKGVGFALDDFGTGYSSLSYLKHLPVDQLKIDKSFVRDILHEPADATIARAIVALAKSVGIAVVAEGVETKEQWRFLAQHGCHAFQGYYFGRPGSVEELPLGRSLGD